MVNSITPSVFKVNLNLTTTKLKVGESLQASAVATGGSGSITYKFQVADEDLTNVVDLPNLADNTASWTASESGNKYILVEAISSHGYTATDKVLVQVEDLANTLKANLVLNTNTITAGSKVTMTTTVSGGSGNYTYKYQVANTSLTSFVDLGTTKSNTYTWKTISAGQRYIVVTVTDSKGATVTAKQLLTITNASVTALAATLTLDSNTVVAKESVNMTVSVTGGSGSYTYKYQVANTSLTSFVDLGTTKNNTYTWKTISAGQRYIVVTVTDSKGATVTAKQLLTITNGATTPLEATLTLSSNKVVAKESVNMTVSVTGGSGSYTYKYQVANTSLTSYVNLGTTKNNTYTWKTISAGQRYIVVTVTDSNGATVTAKQLLTITNGATTPLEATLTLSSNIVTAKESITMTVSAIGGSGNYTYKYQVANTSLTSYVTLTTSSKNSLTWKTTSAGTRIIVVTVTDGNGTIKTLMEPVIIN